MYSLSPARKCDNLAELMMLAKCLHFRPSVWHSTLCAGIIAWESWKEVDGDLLEAGPTLGCQRPAVYWALFISDLVSIISLYVLRDDLLIWRDLGKEHPLTHKWTIYTTKFIDETVNHINHFTFPSLIKTHLICCIYIYPRHFLTPGKSDFRFWGWPQLSLMMSVHREVISIPASVGARRSPAQQLWPK